MLVRLSGRLPLYSRARARLGAQSQAHPSVHGWSRGLSDKLPLFIVGDERRPGGSEKRENLFQSALDVDVSRKLLELRETGRLSDVPKDENYAAPVPFEDRLEEIHDQTSRFAHRALNVFLRPRMVDRIGDLEDLLRHRAIPGVIQGAGVIMTVAVPARPLLTDLERGWMCAKHEDKYTDSVFCGPVYDVRIYSDDKCSSLEFRERAYLSLMLYSPEAKLPAAARLIRAPLDEPFEQRVPFYFYNEHRCPGLMAGGKLTRLAQGVIVSVPPTTMPPRMLWVDLKPFQLGDTITVAHLISPQGSEFLTYVDHPEKPVYQITPVRY